MNVKGCQTIDKIGQFCLPIKSVVCHAKIGRFCLPIKSSYFIVQLEHVLFSMIKSANFFDIGHHGDCLQWEMNISFSYFILFVILWCLLSFIRCRCKYHFAVCILLLCTRNSWS